MTTGQRILLITGGALILAMLLVAAFSLGVYVGQHGWTRAGLVLRGPDPGPAPPAGGASPDGAPLPGGGRPPDLLGRVRDVFEGRLILATRGGPRAVELDPAVRITSPEEGERSLGALQRGQLVAVFGQRSEDGRSLVAERIILLPAGDPQPPAQP